MQLNIIRNHSERDYTYVYTSRVLRLVLLSGVLESAVDRGGTGTDDDTSKLSRDYPVRTIVPETKIMYKMRRNDC